MIHTAIFSLFAAILCLTAAIRMDKVIHSFIFYSFAALNIILFLINSNILQLH